MNLKINWDALGITTSVVCAIHCAILPLVATSLPLFGINIIHNVFFEWSMIVLAFVVGTYSLYHGYVKHHQSFLPVLIFLSGFIFLTAKQFSSRYEYLFLFFAVTLIITAHYYNYRLCTKKNATRRTTAINF